MKHFRAGFLFFCIFFLPVPCLAAIDLTISNFSPKDDYYEITAEVAGMSSSSATFVQGMFTSIESPKYFGFTLSKKGDWLIYDGSPEKTFVTENYIELKNNQQQKIYLKPNFQDKDYLGPGKYFVKLKRYTASGSPSDYSNSIEIDLNFNTPTPQLTSTNTPTIFPTPTKIVTSASTPTTPPKTPTPTPTASFLSPTVTTTIYDLQSTISTNQQVLATTSSTASEATGLGTFGTESISQAISTPESTFSPSLKISDKNLFLVGVSIFSVSSLLLYFRLRNL